jgi:hypothetical protein
MMWVRYRVPFQVVATWLTLQEEKPGEWSHEFDDVVQLDGLLWSRHVIPSGSEPQLESVLVDDTNVLISKVPVSVLNFPAPIPMGTGKRIVCRVS